MKVGEYAVRRQFSRFAWNHFSVGIIKKLSDKTALFYVYRDSRVPLSELIASFPDEKSAQQLKQALDGVAGTYRQKANAAERDFTERKRTAAEAANKAMTNLIAAPQSEETPNG